MDFKRCSKCKEIKPLSDFYFSPAQTKKRGKPIYFSCCRKCNKIDYFKKAPCLRDSQIFFKIANEVWLPVVGFEGFYEISDLGRITSLTGRKKLRTPMTTDEGYLRVQLSKYGEDSCHFVHILVATAFIPNPENKPTVNHKKGIKKDNRAIELEWATYEEQMQHAIKIGLIIYNKGEDCHNSYLTNRQALQIFNSTLSYKELSSIYNVSKNTISNIKRGCGYSCATGKEYKKEGRNKKCTDKDIMNIFNSSLPRKEICRLYNIHTSTISAIKTGLQYSSITGKVYCPNKID